MAFTHFTTAFFILVAGQMVSGAITKRATCSNGHVTRHSTCCQLLPVVDLIQKELFEGAQCGEDAHSALRIAFHDAIGFSLNSNKGGGADGSILQFADIETAYHANGGIDDVTAAQTPIWKQTNLTAGDFLHLAAAVGVANCPGAPRLEYLFGRPPPKAPAPDLTVPEPTDSVTAILKRFDDAGFSAPEVVALLSSHSIAAADEVDPTIPGTPFDSTPGTFDTQFFLEVLLKGSLFPGQGQQPGEVASPIAGEMRLQSDFAISQDPRTACFWQLLVDEQAVMQLEFALVMSKLQVLGQDTDAMVDCSDVIPVPKGFNKEIKYPPTYSFKDVQLGCPILPFPSLSTQPGPAQTIPPVPGFT